MIKQFFYFLLIGISSIVIFLYTSSCQFTSKKESHTVVALDTILEKAAVEINRRPSEQFDYYLLWGSIQIPIEKYANPNGYKGKIQLEIETFKQIMDLPIQLFKTASNEAMPLEIYTLHKYANRWRGPQWFSEPATEEPNQLDPNTVASIRPNLQKGDQISLSLSSTNDEVYISQALIKMKDPFEAYQPAVKVRRPKTTETPFSFQVISQGKKQVLRMDTSNEKTKHILDLYAPRPNYKILHIPHFETHRRLLIQEDNLFDEKTIRYSELIDNDFDIWTLSEFCDFHQKKVKLEWGEMLANPSSKNYAIDTFRRSHAVPLKLVVENEVIPIKGFNIIIKNGEKSPIRFITTHLGVSSILKKLQEVGARSSIYFDNIIVQGKDNRPLHFPIDFVFNIDEPTDYSLTIDEIDTSNLALSKTSWTGYQDSSHQIQYSYFRLSELTTAFLDLPKEKIWLHQFEKDPLLEICYFSKNFPIEYGKEAIFRALQERYKIQPYWKSWQKMYAISTLQTDLIETYRYPDEESDNNWKFSKNFNNNRQELTMTHANPYRLAWEISREFKIMVVNDTFLEGLYQFRLDFSSLENLQMQLLEEYGLQLLPMNDKIEVVVKQY